MSAKIKSVKATRYDKKVNSIMDTELSIVESPMSLTEYDEDGNVIHTMVWGAEGLVSEKFVFEYEGALRTKRMTYADEEELAETEYYEYNEDGNLIKTTLEYLDGSKDFTNHLYNEAKQMISSITVDDDGDEGQQEFWEYEGNNLIRYRMINDFGNLEEEQTYTYNDENLVVAKSIINNLNESNFSWKYQYNSDGKLIVEERFNANGKPVEEVNYTYDEKGRVIEEKTENAKETIVKKMEYDEADNELYTIVREEDDDITLYEVWRKFDAESQQLSSKVIVYANGDEISSEYSVKYERDFY
jgi:hypothetical protein